jgi:16S rRNA (cytidine1402-2'-O)-methyltransferase
MKQNSIFSSACSSCVLLYVKIQISQKILFFGFFLDIILSPPYFPNRNKKFLFKMKKSFLAIVATPIGNLGDITLRALETLRNSQIIAAEDVRRTLKLLNHFEIKKPLISCRAANEEFESERLIEKVLNGENVSYLCDAGTPCISDPGLKLISKALKNGIEPLIIPGVSALTFAVAACALPLAKFAFYGFPPIKSGKRRKFLEDIKNEKKTVFVYESPHRMAKFLQEIAEVLGEDANVAIIREATKIYEECLRGKIADIVYQTKDKSWRGECVIAIYAAPLNFNKPENDYEEHNN